MIHAVFDFIAATDMSLLWDVNGRSARATPLGPWLPAANFTPMAAYIDSVCAFLRARPARRRAPT
jgi:hypothetical protein